jgi:hypothetical protein
MKFKKFAFVAVWIGVCLQALVIPAPRMGDAPTGDQGRTSVGAL